MFLTREARILTAAIGAARLALRALEGKMGGAILCYSLRSAFQHLAKLLVKMGAQ